MRPGVMKQKRELPVVEVAVAVVQREDGRVLLAERPKGKASPGFWELPGGKLDPGETPLQALARELHEEIGVDPVTAYPWVVYEHEYQDKIVRLYFHRVTAVKGVAHGREGQRISWENPDDIRVGPLLPANGRVLRALGLPPVYAITNARKYGIPEFIARLERAFARGLGLVQVREPGLSPEQLAQFIRRVVRAARPYGARVLVNGSEMLALKTGADGVHLPAGHLARMATRPALPLVAASCHGAADLDRAGALGLDFVTLSPVLPTASHPGEPVLGLDGFTRLAGARPFPVYALGGMREADLDIAMRNGAHGIALLSGVW